MQAAEQTYLLGQQVAQFAAPQGGEFGQRRQRIELHGAAGFNPKLAWRWWDGGHGLRRLQRVYFVAVARDVDFGARIDDLPGLFQRLLLMLVIVRDQMPTGIAPTGKLAYFVAGVEDELLGLIRRGGEIGA